MRRGFSLLELVISIVVMGIVFLSIPTMMVQNSQNNTAAIVQQSVMDTKTRVALVLKAPWGCTGQTDPLIVEPTPIFGALPNFYDNNLIDATDRRTYSSLGRNTPCAATEGQDISSFHKQSLDLNINVNAPIGDEKQPIYTRDAIVSANMITTVNASNMNGAADNDIKEIAITTNAQTSPATIITLRAYSANIGDSPTIQTKTW